MDKVLQEHLRKLGRKGGKSKSPKRLAALAKARKVLAAKRRAAKRKKGGRT
jgi:hypothetical protein